MIEEIPNLAYPAKGQHDIVLDIITRYPDAAKEIFEVVKRFRNSAFSIRVPRLADYVNSRLPKLLEEEDRILLKQGLEEMGRAVPSRHRRFYWSWLYSILLDFQFVVYGPSQSEETPEPQELTVSEEILENNPEQL